METILSKEPKLLLLFDDCKKIKKISNIEKHRYWGKKLKPRMVKLVGYFCDNENLNSSEVYNKVYFHCLDLMEL